MDEYEALALAAAAKQRQESGIKERVGDVLRSGASGLARGATATLDFPARIPGMAVQAGSYIGEKVGLIDPETGQKLRRDISEMGSLGGATYQAENAAPEVMQYAPTTLPGEVTQTVGEFLPGMAFGATAKQMVAAGLGSEAGGQVMKDTQYEPMARLAGGVLGGLAATPKPTSTTSGKWRGEADRAAAARRLQEKGIKPTGGQFLDRAGAMRVEGTLSATPKQLDQFTSASLKTTGYTGPSLRATSRVLSEQSNAITKGMNKVLDIDVPLSKRLGERALGVADDYLADTPGQNLPLRIRNVASELADAATDPSGKPIPATLLRKWRTNLGRYTTSKDEAVRDAAHDLREVIDEATEEALTALGKAEDVAKLKELRTQYRNLLVVTDATTRGGRTGASGVLSPERVSTAAKRILGRTNYAMGKGTELAELSNDALMIIGSAPTVSAGGVRDIVNAGVTGLGGAVVGAQAGGLGPAAAGMAAGALAPTIARAAARTGVTQSAMMQPENILRGLVSAGPGSTNAFYNQ